MTSVSTVEHLADIDSGLQDAHLIVKHRAPSPPAATATACLAGAGSDSKGWNQFQNIAIISVIPDMVNPGYRG